jgi:hypothetical protein
MFNERRYWFLPLIGIAIFTAVGFVVMLLWNNLLPEILGVKTITFWQAIGIFILSKILFGFGKGGRMGPPWKRGRMAERFKEMTPEEREVFKEKMQHWRC